MYCRASGRVVCKKSRMMLAGCKHRESAKKLEHTDRDKTQDPRQAEQTQRQAETASAFTSAPLRLLVRAEQASSSPRGKHSNHLDKEDPEKRRPQVHAVKSGCY